MNASKSDHRTNGYGQLIYDPKFRAVFFQVCVLAGVAWFGYEIVSNTIINLEKRKIASGFDFLNTTAGFGIIQTLIPYSEGSTYGRAFLVGLLNTLLVAVLGIILSTILGFIIGLARLSRNWLVSNMAGAYVEIIRNVPLLLQLFFWYFAVLRALPSPRQSFSFPGEIYLNNRGLYFPNVIFEQGSGLAIAACLATLAGVIVHRWRARRQQMETGQSPPSMWYSAAAIIVLPMIVLGLTGFPFSADLPHLRGFNFVGGIKIIPELAALLLALTIYTAAYIAEVVRAGVQAVSRGQIEAAYSLGLRRVPSLRLIIVPQALRVIIPPLTNQYLNLTKNSSLAVAIAYPDLVSVFAGVVLNQTGQAVEVLLITMAVYLCLSLLTALLMNWYNARTAIIGH